jgi:hypothetical protein
VAVGPNALDANTTGANNTALGSDALQANTTATNGTAVGWGALSSNTTGYANTALGDQALALNTTGSGNSAIGNAALIANTTGLENTAVGVQSLYSNTTGNNNTILGSFVASTTLATGSNNILIGTDQSTDTVASNSSNTLNIGNAIYGTNLQNTTNTGGTAFIGIGTAAPSYPLEVVGNIKAQSLATGDLTGITIGNNGSDAPKIEFNQSDNSKRFWLQTNGINTGSERLTLFGGPLGNRATIEMMSFAGTGNVGVGTTTPAQTLDVNGIIRASAQSTPSNWTDAAYFLNQTGVGPTIAGANIAFVTNGSERMRVTTGGNVGIGTASPTAPLHVNRSAPGTISSSGTTVTGTATTFTTTFAVGDSIMSAGQTQTIATIPGDTSLTTSVAFSPVIPAGAAYTRVGAVFNSGNVGIGSTTPGTALDVNGAVTVEPTSVTLTSNNTVLATANRSYFQLTSDDTTEANRVFCFGPGTLGQVLVVEWTSSTNRGEIVSHGNCGGAAGAVPASITYTNWAPKHTETILQLMYNGTHWIQIAGSANY